MLQVRARLRDTHNHRRHSSSLLGIRNPSPSSNNQVVIHNHRLHSSCRLGLSPISGQLWICPGRRIHPIPGIATAGHRIPAIRHASATAHWIPTGPDSATASGLCPTTRWLCSTTTHAVSLASCPVNTPGRPSILSSYCCCRFCCASSCSISSTVSCSQPSLRSPASSCIFTGSLGHLHQLLQPSGVQLQSADRKLRVQQWIPARQ